MNTIEKVKFVLSNQATMLHMSKTMLSRYLPVKAYPFVLQINLDSVCNIQCFFCAYEGREGKPDFNVKNLDKLDKAIRQAKYISLSAWGDPCCSRNLFVVLDKIFSLNAATNLIAIVTNGTRLSSDLADKLTGHLGSLTISLNAATKQTYERDMVRARWDSTLAQAKNFTGALNPEDRSKVNLHMVAHSQNYHEIPELIFVAKYLGISSVRVDQFTANLKEFLPLRLTNFKAEYNQAVDKASGVAQSEGISFTARKFGVETKTQDCLSPWSECHVWADGRVAPCDCNGTLFLGNAYESSFEDVWFGKAYRDFRNHGAAQCKTCPKILPFDDERGHVSPYLTERMKGVK
jgi:MoaA/NifB/PqqE/SkfB family radical SAM enzyme